MKNVDTQQTNKKILILLICLAFSGCAVLDGLHQFNYGESQEIRREMAMPPPKLPTDAELSKDLEHWELTHGEWL